MLPSLKPHYEQALPNVLPFGPMEIFPCMVDAALASALLESNQDNRKLRPSIVHKYASDMAMGKWRMTPVAICFDQDDRLGNGQHTLSSIAKTGRPQLLLIAINVPRESIAMMDVGLNRTFQDIAHFVGADFDSPCSAIAKIMRFGKPAGGAKSSMSFELVLSVYQHHKQAIDFAINATNGTKVTGVNAITRSVVAMAWYTQDHDRLIEFMQCLKTGIINGAGDTAAAKLRDLFMKTSIQGAGGTGRQEVFMKAKTALEHFLARNPVSKLYGTEKDIFPYPRFEA